MPEDRRSRKGSFPTSADNGKSVQQRFGTVVKLSLNAQSVVNNNRFIEKTRERLETIAGNRKSVQKTAGSIVKCNLRSDRVVNATRILAKETPAALIHWWQWEIRAARSREIDSETRKCSTKT